MGRVEKMKDDAMQRLRTLFSAVKSLQNKYIQSIVNHAVNKSTIAKKDWWVW